VWDDGLPGFGVRINPTNRQWVVQYRASGKSRRETIGRVDRIPLEMARTAARRSLAKVELGADPQAEKVEARARASITLGSVAERYLANSKDRLKPRSYEETERNLVKHWGSLHPVPAHKITRAIIASRLEEIAANSGPIASNRSRAALSALFSWAMGAGIVDENPVAGAIKLADEVSRDHVISDSELAAVWHACRDDDHGYIVRLLLLTGQRRDEIGSMVWSEVDLDRAVWTIPAKRTKNGRPHDVPLSLPVVEILRGLPRREGRSFIFGGGQGGFSGWSKSKARLDARIAKAGNEVRHWRLHDLRRTAATRMAELGTLPHVIEAVLNHLSGHQAGVAGIYNRASYSMEKREALDQWASHVTRLASAQRDQEIPLLPGVN
jgi:integrase